MLAGEDLEGQHPFIMSLRKNQEKGAGASSRIKNIIENFSELGDNINRQIERAHQVPSR